MAREKYIGQQCISCRATFNNDDDIVVCPECGSPYHRECYKNEGKCINTVLHEKGEDWKPDLPTTHHTNFVPLNPIADEISTAPITDVSIPEPKEEQYGAASYQEEYTKHYCPVCNAEVKADDAFCPKCGMKLGANDSAEKKNICPACQLENRPNDIFCARCGTPLDMERATGHEGFFGSPFINVQRLKPESEIDGNTIDEYTRYVGGRFFSFIPKFLKFSKQGTKLSFNLWAFIFPQFYFFYRKMNGIGVVSLIATILLSLPSVFDYLAAIGVLSTAILESQLFLNIIMIFYVLTMVFKFACGMFADWLYFNKAKSDIGKIKNTVLEPEARKFSISAKGGTSWIGVLVATTVMVIINIAIMIVITALAVM